jgi:hypothetical protein
VTLHVLYWCADTWLLLCFDWLQRTEASVISRDSHYGTGQLVYTCIWCWYKDFFLGMHGFLCSCSHGLQQSLFNSVAAGW